jgi:hypothetical protein
MFKHILIPTDGSELSRTAITNGIALAKSVQGRVTILTASPSFHVLAADPAMVTDTKERRRGSAEVRAGIEGYTRVRTKSVTWSCGSLPSFHRMSVRATISRWTADPPSWQEEACPKRWRRSRVKRTTCSCSWPGAARSRCPVT